MEISFSGTMILGGVILLWLGGEGLVRGAASIALRQSISKLVVGLTIIAFGTSMPELAAGVTAVIRGVIEGFDPSDPANPANLALGNVIGSNIANIGLILGLCALIKPIGVRQSIIRREMAFLIIVSILVILLGALEGELGRFDGAVLLAVFAAFLGYTFLKARQESEEDEIGRSSKSGLLDGALVVSGGAALVGGAQLFVIGGIGLATALGVPTIIIGLTIIAIGTSLPELAASLVAVLKGHADLTVGNVVGSNIFNLLLILGVVALIQPLPCDMGKRWVDFMVMLGIALLAVPLMSTKKGLTRMEGLLLLVIYCGYIAWLGHSGYGLGE